MDKTNVRKKILKSLGANEKVTNELLLYNQNNFKHPNIKNFPIFPIPDEPFVKIWEGYVQESHQKGIFETLKSKLIQLSFPIRLNISKADEYNSVVKKGLITEISKNERGVILADPKNLQLIIKKTPAGHIPIIITGNRPDFISMTRALVYRNEPIQIPDSMGAIIVRGYNNWDRIHNYKDKWIRKNPKKNWDFEFRRLIHHRELYQDTFIILSPGYYSNILPQRVGLSENDWADLSIKLRTEHECMHYFTRRVLGAMSNRLYDELLADYMALIKALGYFRADWFLLFTGLESYPVYRQGGRLENYLGDPPLSNESFEMIQSLVKLAAENLERLNNDVMEMEEKDQVYLVLAFSFLTLEELLSKNLCKEINKKMNPFKH